MKRRVRQALATAVILMISAFAFFSLGVIIVMGTVSNWLDNGKE